MVVVEELDVETTTLDRFAQGLSDHHIDFTYPMWKARSWRCFAADRRCSGQARSGNQDRVLVGSDPAGQPSFAELDIFLRANGFYLFDLELHNYQAYMRSSLPAGRLRADSPKLARCAPERQARSITSWPSLSTGDALHSRHPVSDRIAGRSTFGWDLTSVLRLCTLLDLFDYGDCVIEVLQDFQQQGAVDLNF